MLTIRTICITLLSAFALQANAWMGHNDFQRAERFIIPNSELRIVQNLWGLDIDGTLQGAGGVGGLLAVNSYTSTNNSQFLILNSQLDETYLPTYDANGNISEYINSANGTIVAHYDYSPFGEQILASGSRSDTFTHRFSTKPWCEITGLIECQYRKYHPSLGRWLSRDPIEEQGGVNLYVMCGNNGVGRYDYLGFSNDRAAEFEILEPKEIQENRWSVRYSIGDKYKAKDGCELNFIQITWKNNKWRQDSASTLPFYFNIGKKRPYPQNVFMDAPTATTWFYLLAVEVCCESYLENLCDLKCCQKYKALAIDFVAWNTLRGIPQVKENYNKEHVKNTFSKVVINRKPYSIYCEKYKKKMVKL